LNIKFFYDGINFRLKRSERKKKFLEKIIMDENKIPGDLFFIFTYDESIREINKEFLEHDYFTDVISFGYSEGDIVNGEVYISIETVQRNAVEYKVRKDDEIMRIIIHGLLHLCGYKDSGIAERKEMFLKQEELLEKFKELSG